MLFWALAETLVIAIEKRDGRLTSARDLETGTCCKGGQRGLLLLDSRPKGWRSLARTKPLTWRLSCGPFGADTCWAVCIFASLHLVAANWRPAALGCQSGRAQTVKTGRLWSLVALRVQQSLARFSVFSFQPKVRLKSVCLHLGWHFCGLLANLVAWCQFEATANRHSLLWPNLRRISPKGAARCGTTSHSACQWRAMQKRH